MMLRGVAEPHAFWEVTGGLLRKASRPSFTRGRNPARLRQGSGGRPEFHVRAKPLNL
jgi:hypothetical protein